MIFITSPKAYCFWKACNWCKAFSQKCYYILSLRCHFSCIMSKKMPEPVFQKTDAGDREVFIKHNCSITEDSVTKSLYCSRLGGEYRIVTSGYERRDWKGMFQKQWCLQFHCNCYSDNLWLLLLPLTQDTPLGTSDQPQPQWRPQTLALENQWSSRWERAGCNSAVFIFFFPLVLAFALWISPGASLVQI